MENAELRKFVSDSRAHGRTDAEIKAQLLQSGWPADAVNLALSAAVSSPTESLTMQVGTPKDNASDLGLWAAFEYVLMFISLAFAATGAAGLLHHLVDTKIAVKAVTDNYYSFSYYSDYLVPVYISSLLVGFPLFAFLALRLRSLITKRPEVRQAKIRKVAIYLALIWTFMAMIIRVDGTVYSFVKGNEFMGNSICHLIVTLLVSGGIFAYFAFEVRQDGKV